MKKQKSQANVAGEAAPAPVEAVAIAKQPAQNGVTRPRSGTATGRVWEIADALSAAQGKPVARGEVLKTFEAEGGNSSTGATQYGRWRKFHGLGRYAVTEAAPGAPIDAPEIDEDDDE